MVALFLLLPERRGFQAVFQYSSVASMLLLTIFGVVGLGVFATLRWVTWGGSEPKGIVLMSDSLVPSCLESVATAAFKGTVTPSSGSARGDYPAGSTYRQGYPERSLRLRVPIIRSDI